jgi:hypothetical protein
MGLAHPYIRLHARENHSRLTDVLRLRNIQSILIAGVAQLETEASSKFPIFCDRETYDFVNRSHNATGPNWN